MQKLGFRGAYVVGSCAFLVIADLVQEFFKNSFNKFKVFWTKTFCVDQLTLKYKVNLSKTDILLINTAVKLLFVSSRKTVLFIARVGRISNYGDSRPVWHLMMCPFTFCLNLIPSLGNFVNNNVKNQKKTKPTSDISFKTCILTR